MSGLELTAAIGLSGLFIGILDSLTGPGEVDLRYAGASLLCVIATSSGSAARYVRQCYSNIRIGMFLEIATSAGAVAGALIGPRVPAAWIWSTLGMCGICRRREPSAIF